ncbi:hypothetical protein L1049_014844 [Liquidambar formosana]|uniref:Uncharacterized protein n=1 Tax=Liquidambar formosana TaxID=63359 RepID=A0AAP0X197_LIQFO
MEEARTAIFRLNGVAFRHSKLIVKLADFGWDSLIKNSSAYKRECSKNGNHHFSSYKPMSRVGDGVSTEVALDGVVNNKENGFESIVAEEVDEEWLLRCAVGEVICIESIPLLEDIINTDLACALSIRPLRGNMVLIVFHDVDSKQFILKDEGSKLSNWRIGNCVGRVISIDSCTSQRKILDRGRVLVSTKLMNICKTFSLKVLHREYVVRVHEESRFSIPIHHGHDHYSISKGIVELPKSLVKDEIEKAGRVMVEVNQDRSVGIDVFGLDGGIGSDRTDSDPFGLQPILDRLTCESAIGFGKPISSQYPFEVGLVHGGVSCDVHSDPIAIGIKHVTENGNVCEDVRRTKGKNQKCKSLVQSVNWDTFFADMREDDILHVFSKKKHRRKRDRNFGAKKK